MPDNNNTQNNNAQNNNEQYSTNVNFEKAVEAMKGAYSYLHPDYRRRKLFHLIFVVPMMFIIYGMIYGLILMDLTDTTNATMPWILKFIDLILIVASTIASAFFYPFSLWWYKQSLIGRILNNMYYIGSFWVVILKIIGTLIGGIAIAGTLSPIMGPLTLRKCKRKNMIIGDAEDFM